MTDACRIAHDRMSHLYAIFGAREAPLKPLTDSTQISSLERFRAKWSPVRVKKTRQNKKIERARDSIQSERALKERAVHGVATATCEFGKVFNSQPHSLPSQIFAVA
jgi:hypothetical protein